MLERSLSSCGDLEALDAQHSDVAPGARARLSAACPALKTLLVASQSPAQFSHEPPQPLLAQPLAAQDGSPTCSTSSPEAFD